MGETPKTAFVGIFPGENILCCFARSCSYQMFAFLEKIRNRRDLGDLGKECKTNPSWLCNVSAVTLTGPRACATDPWASGEGALTQMFI